MDVVVQAVLDRQRFHPIDVQLPCISLACAPELVLALKWSSSILEEHPGGAQFPGQAGASPCSACMARPYSATLSS